MPLADAIATPDGKRRYVRRLFATIADRYDLITVLLSYGQDRRWKQRLIALAAPSGARAVDLATGTGDIAFGLAAAGADVIGVDVTLRMIQLANLKKDDRHRTPEYGSNSTSPDSASAFTIVVAVPGVTDSALAT